MKTHTVFRLLALTSAVVLGVSFSSCSNVVASSPKAPTDTSDAKYLAGTLASWELSQDSGQTVEDPAELLSSDTASTSKALNTASVVVNADGTVTVTKAGKHWSGVYVTQVITRPKRPTKADVATAVVSQSATEQWYTGTATSGTPFATITVAMVWTKDTSGNVVLKSLTRSGERIGFGTASPHLLTIDVVYTDGVLTKKTVSHYSPMVAAANLLYIEEFEKVVASGTTAAYTKITRKNGAGAIVNYRTITTSGLTDTVKRYSSTDVLREMTVRTDTGTGWTLTRTGYKVDGTTVKWTTSESVTLEVSGSTTKMTRLVTPADGITYQIVFEVSVNGNVYTISKTVGSTVLRWTAELKSGTWTITPVDGTPGTVTTVADDDII